MANIMNMVKIKNRTSRNGFDLSQKINFTAKCSELLPVWWTPVLPTDNVQVKVRNFIRTQPLNTAAFARMRGYYDFYFVPYSQMWNKFNTVITQLNANLQHASGPTLNDNQALSGSLPYITAQQLAEYVTSLGATVDLFGMSRAYMTCKLLEYLGYGLYYDYISSSVTDGADGNPYPGKTWSNNSMAENAKFSPFPLFAYQKIYADYNRYTQWESTNPASFNCDYIKGTDDLQLDLTVSGFSSSFNFLDMRYSNWQRDMLHGTLPVAQYGEASFVSIDSSGSQNITLPTGVTLQAAQMKANVNVNTSTFTDNLPPLLRLSSTSASTKDIMFQVGELTQDSDGSHVNWTGGDPVDITSWTITGTNSSAGSINVSNSLKASLSILELRRAEAAQKWKEITLSAEEDYRSQISAHWGANVSALLSDMCQYLDGFAVNLDINEVVNTNITAQNAADIAGKGTMSGQGGFSYQANGQYGILMCIFHVLPLLDYVTSAPLFGTQLVEATDYPIPEFDSIGMESIPAVRGWNPTGPLNKLVFSHFSTFGYAPRYIDWKTALDRSCGAFRDTLKTWILPFDDLDMYEAIYSGVTSILPENPNVPSTGSLSASYFKVPVQSLDSLFAVAVDNTNDTDQFLCSNFFDVKVVRSLDVNGLPY